MEIIRGKQKQFMRAVIYGPEGIGKSTLGSYFPKPLFIDVEGGTHALDVARIGTPKSWAALMQILDNIASPQFHNEYESLVIDTADWAEKMLKEAVCAEAGVVSLSDIAYGLLYQKVGAKWGSFLDKLSLIAKKMHVVLLAHSQMVRCEIPEEIGSFDRYELKLNYSSKVNNSAMTKEWASMVLFLNYQIFLVEVEGKNKAQGGSRVIYTTHATSWDAKNRYELPKEIQMPQGKMPPELQKVLAENTPELFTTAPIQQAQPVQQVQQPKPAAVVEPTPAPTPEPVTTPEPEPTPATPAPEPVKAELPQLSPQKKKLLEQLKELMNVSGFSLAELDAEMARMKIVPAGTNPNDYNETLLNRIINNWGAVSFNINNSKNNA